MTCKHLRSLELAIRSEGTAVIDIRSEPYKETGEWVYFGAVLDLDAIRKTFELAPCVVRYSNGGDRGPTDEGLICEDCRDAVIGVHPVDMRSRYKHRFPSVLRRRDD
jgi:hypothetical protein